MKKERFLVTTKNHHGSHTEIWDSGHPKPLGYPFKWVLENTTHGVRMRNIVGKPGVTNKDVTIQIPANAIQKEEYIDVPHDSGNTKHFHKVKITRLHGVRPPYMYQDGKEKRVGEDHLLAFSGVRRSLINSQEVFSAYIAYAKTNPVFSFYHKKDKYTIKPLLNEVQLKLKGQQPMTAEPGTSWDLTEEELLNCTIIRGIYWWKFNKVKLSPNLVDEEERKKGVAPIPFFRTPTFIVSALLSILMMTVILVPEPPVDPKKDNKGIVQLKFKTTNHTEAVKLGNQKEASKLPEVADATAFEQMPKPDPARSNAKKVQTQLTPSGPPKPSAAAAQTQKIKSMFKGFQSLMSMNTKVKEVFSGGGDKNSKIFDNSGDNGLGKTNVKVDAKGSFGKVDGIGGGKAGGDGANTGYGSGKQGSPLGTPNGTSLVDLSPAASQVDEGLTKEEVGKVIHDHMDEVRACHEMALVINQKAAGKLMVNFSIGPDGRVKKAVPADSSMAEYGLDNCIIKKLVTWQFPRPKGGVTVAVSYPFIFKTLGRGE